MNWCVHGDIWKGGKLRFGDCLKIYKQYWNEVILEYSVTSYLGLETTRTSKHPSIITWSFCSRSAYHISLFYNEGFFFFFFSVLCYLLMGRDINPHFRDFVTTKLASYLSLLFIIVIIISYEMSSHSAYLLQLASSPDATQLAGSQHSPWSGAH